VNYPTATQAQAMRPQMHLPLGDQTLPTPVAVGFPFLFSRFSLGLRTGAKSKISKGVRDPCSGGREGGGLVNWDPVC
jgi:hypothetical protein